MVTANTRPAAPGGHDNKSLVLLPSQRTAKGGSRRTASGAPKPRKIGWVASRKGVGDGSVRRVERDVKQHETSKERDGWLRSRREGTHAFLSNRSCGGTAVGARSHFACTYCIPSVEKMRRNLNTEFVEALGIGPPLSSSSSSPPPRVSTCHRTPAVGTLPSFAITPQTLTLEQQVT